MKDDFIIALQIPGIRVDVEISITLLGFSNPTSRSPAVLAPGYSDGRYLPCLPTCVLGILFTPHIVCALLICSGLLTEGHVIALTAYKILLYLILSALSFSSSHLSVGFCVQGSAHQHFTLSPLKTAPVSEVLSLGKAVGTICTGQVGELKENNPAKPLHSAQLIP